MQINSLRLKNFRNFEDETFYFHPKFTVAIGVNGAGKSSLLHGLRIASGCFLLGVPSNEAQSRHIQEDEIRQIDNEKSLRPQYPVIVEAEGILSKIDHPIKWRRQWGAGKSRNSAPKADVGEIKDIGQNKFTQMWKEGVENLDLPLIAFLGTSRVHGEGRKRGKRKGREMFKEGYHSWLEMKSSKFRYPDWLASHARLQKSGKENPESKIIFKKTIEKAFGGKAQVAIEDNELWLKINFMEVNSQWMPVNYHSDGIRAYAEMVAELAYRCIVLNWTYRSKAVKETRGIVMIDEIDLHLHPNWQKEVVHDLSSAFPNIQFVATTHSPIIVQSLKAEQVINLDRPDLPLDEDPNQMALSQVATEVMGLDGTRSEDFAKRYEQAKYMLAAAKKENGEILVNDYQKARDLLDGLEIESTNDPVYKAYLELKSENK